MYYPQYNHGFQKTFMEFKNLNVTVKLNVILKHYSKPIIQEETPNNEKKTWYLRYTVPRQ